MEKPQSLNSLFGTEKNKTRITYIPNEKINK